MHKIAEAIGLPASFVDIRHQATHQDLPSLVVLRSATHRALAWLWDHYWQKIDQAGDPHGMARGTTSQDGRARDMDGVESALKDVFRDILRSYVKWKVRNLKGKKEEEARRRGKGPKMASGGPNTEQDTKSDGRMIEETCNKCVKICRDDPVILSVLVDVLAETRFLIPANRG